MLRFLLLTLGILSYGIALTQEVCIGLYTLKTSSSGLSVQQIEALDNKIHGWITSVNGYSAADTYATIGLKPMLTFGQPRKVEAGLKNLTVIDAELTLTLQQRDGNPVFGSYTKKITASGNDTNSAKRELLTKISSSDKGFSNFMQENMPKVNNYYIEHCDDIRAEAEKLSSIQDYDKALGILVNIPASLPCHQATRGLIQSLYQKNRDNLCRSTLLKAKAAAEKMDFDTTIRLLGKIDPEAICFSEATEFLHSLQARIDNNYAIQMETLKAYYLAKAKIDAQQEIIIIREHLTGRY